MAKSWKDESAEELLERFKGVSAALMHGHREPSNAGHSSDEYLKAQFEGAKVLADSQQNPPEIAAYIGLILPPIPKL